MTISTDIRNSLFELKCGIANVAAELKFQRFVRAMRIKFDPDQPLDEAGKWTDGGGTTAEHGSVIGEAATLLLAAGRQSAAFCWNQMQIDMLLWSLQPASRRAICRAHANQRYGACLAGTAIPPLSY
ncbi:MAG: hypothetical protein V4602_15170 [Pseudomonadota bacterium]